MEEDYWDNCIRHCKSVIEQLSYCKNKNNKSCNYMERVAVRNEVYQKCKQYDSSDFLDHLGKLELLASGSYGKVYKTTIKTKQGQKTNIAIKIQQYTMETDSDEEDEDEEDDEDEDSEASDCNCDCVSEEEEESPMSKKFIDQWMEAASWEIKCLQWTSALVELNVSPFFPMLHYAQWLVEEVVLVEELSDCTLHKFLRQCKMIPTPVAMSFVLQCLIAVYHLSVGLDVCHNDLYFNNILMSQVDPAIMEFSVAGSVEPVRFFNFGVLLKFVDFGLVSSPTMIQRPHENLFPYYYEKGKEKDASKKQPNIKDHILLFNKYPPFARDLFSILISFKSIMKTSREVLKWISKSLDLLHQMVTSGKFFHRQDTQTFLNHICNESFLQQFQLSYSFVQCINIPHIYKLFPDKLNNTNNRSNRPVIQYRPLETLDSEELIRAAEKFQFPTAVHIMLKPK